MEKKELRPIAVIECCEEIPCNPCMSACPHHAIVIEGGIHHIPQLKPELCVGVRHLCGKMFRTGNLCSGTGTGVWSGVISV